MHTILRDPALNGWEYGMLRSFETAIVEETAAVFEDVPEYIYTKKYIHHFGHGMTRGKYRKYFPKQVWKPEGEIAWYVLMGPENYKMDLFKGWDEHFRLKVLYLYDTFPSQYPLIKKLCGNNIWDILITSFNDAVNDLEDVTGRKWYCIEQAFDKRIFNPVSLDEKVIHFSSYGRRYTVLHEVVRNFCEQKQLYYDYTTHDGKHPTAPSSELYKQYAWHLKHSLFTFSWPVELTNAARAGHLHPITCRWFEAMATGTVILGRKPGNSMFDISLDEDLVFDLDPAGSKQDLMYRLEQAWDRREELYQKAQTIRRNKGDKVSWNNRVKDILKIVEDHK